MGFFEHSERNGHKMKITAVIPIKLNNERLPGKNTMLLGDKPLITYIQQSLTAVEYIDKIYVYCSDNSIKKYLIPQVDFMQRPQYLDLKTSNFTQIFDSFRKSEDADIFVYAHATAPFITVNTIKKCIDSVVSGKYDSAFCAAKIQDYLWQNGEPLNFDASNLPRSQDIQPIYRETSGVYVFTKEVFENYRSRIGVRPFIHEVTFKESIDINNINDFKLAEIMLNNEI